MTKIERWPEDHFALADADVKPEQLADDGVDRRGKPVLKPWGHEVEIYGQGALSITRLMMNPGSETSLHCHPSKDAVLVVESGSILLETLHGSYECRPGEIVHVQNGAFHRLRTVEGAVVLEVESPRNKNDLVRLKDLYGRAGKGYERAHL